MLVFYDAGLSPFAQKVKMALIEKGVPFERRQPDLADPPADFIAASPRREIPALVDGDAAIFDSTLILEYLDEKWAERPLLPAEPEHRARVRMIEEVCDSRFEAVIFGVTEIVAFRRAEGELAERIIGQGRKDAAALLAWLENRLGGRPWFNGSDFGFGDIAALPYVHTASLYKMGPAEGSALADWLARARQRPSFQRCIADAKADVAAFKEAAASIRSGRWPRQYRDHRLDWMIGAGGIEIVQAGLADGSIRLGANPATGGA